MFRRWFVWALSLWIGATLLTSAQTFKVLVLAGNISQAEFPVLSNIQKLNSFQFEWEQTADRALPGLDNFDILYIGQGEICENAYFFNADTENKIKKFVEDGGVVIAIGQDSDGGRPCEDGWLPIQLLGVERGGTEIFEATNAPEVGTLFEKPNAVNQAHFDDAWTQPPPEMILLAKINGGQDVGIGLVSHGRGHYIVTSLENESAADVQTNEPILENLLYYAANLIVSQAVDPAGKAALTWGQLKRRY